MDYQEESSEVDKQEVQNNLQNNNSYNLEYLQGEDDSQIPNTSVSDRPKKGLWIALFISVIVLFFLILFVASMQHDATTVSKNEIIRGEESQIKENNSLKFKFGGEEHNIKIGFLGVGSVDLIIESDPINVHLLINETQFFDLNKDNETDLKIKLIDIKSGKAVLLIKRVDGDFCIPNWQCNQWNECLNRIKERNCVDLNECGKEKSIPKEEIFCIEESINISEFIGNGLLNCSENNASICNSSQKCIGELINSSDSLKCCLGKCIDFQLNESIYSISCDKPIREFKEASNNCTFFNLNCQEEIFFPALGLIRNINITFELKGYNNGSCIFYYAYTNYSINYSNEKFQELFDQGKTFEQINFQIDSLSSGFYSVYIDKNITCYYPVNDLKIFLYKWETGKETWNLDVLGKYKCEGSLK